MPPSHIDLLSFLGNDLANIRKFCTFNETNTFVSIDGCVLVYGKLPVSDILKVSEMLPLGAVIDIELSKLAGCTIGGGLRKDTDQLKERLKPFYVDWIKSHYSQQNLTDNAQRWLQTGSRGASSEAIFQRVLGIAVDDSNSSTSTSLPYHGRDFRLCRLLIEQVPEIKDNLSRMADISISWAKLIQNWSYLENEMDEECPEWRSCPDGLFEKTSSALRRVTN